MIGDRRCAGMLGVMADRCERSDRRMKEKEEGEEKKIVVSESLYMHLIYSVQGI